MGRLERVPRPAIDVLSATIIRDSYRYRHRKVSSSVAYGKKCGCDVIGMNSYLGNTRSASKISQILSISGRGMCVCGMCVYILTGSLHTYTICETLSINANICMSVGDIGVYV